MMGSSPLTRGKLDARPRGRNHRRLIPAHAGKTEDRGFTGHATWAHPRSRGENLHAPSLGFSSSGSSPLTRGKRRASDCPVVISGLIPAHAGKTQYPAKRREGGQAHPRSRGENGLSLGARGLGGGSSPLTRGKHVPEAWAAKENGLIPAHAGKTIGVKPSISSEAAHPRSRGENRGSVFSVISVFGSSPLTRGKPPSKPPNG